MILYRAVTTLCLAILFAPIAANAGDVRARAVASPGDSAAVAYWGNFPAPADSVTQSFDNRKRSAWEWPLIVPYSVINIPLRGIRYGMRETALWVDRNDLFRFINLVPVPKGVVPRVDYSSQAGVGFGASYYNVIGASDNSYRLRAQYSTRRWQKYTVGVVINRGGDNELAIGAGYRVRPNVRFFGIGPNSNRDDESFFKDQRSWAGARLQRKVTGPIKLAALVGYSSVEANLPASGNDPTLLEKFPGTVTPGFDDRSQGVLFRLSAVANNTRNYGNPDRGTVGLLSASAFLSTSDDDTKLVSYRAELQQFVPLLHSKRALALRGYINWLENHGDGDIPFQRLYQNEAPDLFRGYETGRWRDRGITGFTAEYRFPFLVDRLNGGFGMDTVALLDLGQVFHRFEDISMDNVTSSYGFGLRASMGPAFAGAMEFVWSDEGFQLRLSTKQLFQFARDDFYSGREETLIH